MVKRGEGLIEAAIDLAKPPEIIIETPQYSPCIDMEKAVVKRGEGLVEPVMDLA